MVPFARSDFISPAQLIYWRWLLWRSQYFPEEKLEWLQSRLLISMLEHCFIHVPWYRAQLDRLGIKSPVVKHREIFYQLPILKKQDLASHGDDLKADGFEKYGPKLVHTTGSTGSPMRTYWDKRSNVLELICQWRQNFWFGYRLGMPFLDIRNYHSHLKEKVLWNPACRSLETSIRFWDEVNIEECARLLRTYKIKFWRGHPGALYQLACFFQEKGIEDIRPLGIVTVGEKQLEFQRIFMENWIGRPVGDNYGLTEHTAMFCKCPHGNFHIASEYGFVEILKEDGSPAGPGEEGRIISTGLHNKAFPLLRYDTGDYAVVSGETCSCGRTLPLVREFVGRVDDHVFDAEGRKLAGLHRVFRYLRGIRCSQIVQSVRGELDVYVVPNRDFNQTIKEEIERGFLCELEDRMRFDLHIVKTLPYADSRKTKFIVSLIR